MSTFLQTYGAVAHMLHVINSYLVQLTKTGYRLLVGSRSLSILKNQILKHTHIKLAIKWPVKQSFAKKFPFDIFDAIKIAQCDRVIDPELFNGIIV